MQNLRFENVFSPIGGAVYIDFLFDKQNTIIFQNIYYSMSQSFYSDFNSTQDTIKDGLSVFHFTDSLIMITNLIIDGVHN